MTFRIRKSEDKKEEKTAQIRRQTKEEWNNYPNRSHPRLRFGILWGGNEKSSVKMGFVYVMLIGLSL